MVCKLQKTKTHPLIFPEEQEKIIDKHPRHSHNFTDDFKQEKTIGCAAVYNGKIIKKHPLKDISIFNAEACAVNMVFDLMEKSKIKDLLFFLSRQC